MWDCPLCGARQEERGVCTRCGYNDDAPGDIPETKRTYAERSKEAYKKTAGKRKSVMFLKLQSLDLNATPIEEVKQTIAEVLTGLDIPLKIEAEYTLVLEDEDREIVNIVEQVTEMVNTKLSELPESPDTLVRLGNLEYGVGSYIKALGFYNASLRSNPNHKFGLYNKALALFAIHDYSRSVKALEKLLDKFPDDMDAQRFFGLAEQMVLDQKF